MNKLKLHFLDYLQTLKANAIDIFTVVILLNLFIDYFNGLLLFAGALGFAGHYIYKKYI